MCVSVCVSFAKPGNPASTLYNRVLNLVLRDFQALAFDNNLNPALKSTDVIERLSVVCLQVSRRHVQERRDWRIL